MFLSLNLYKPMKKMRTMNALVLLCVLCVSIVACNSKMETEPEFTAKDNLFDKGGYDYSISVSFIDKEGNDLVAPLAAERYIKNSRGNNWEGEINPDKYSLDRLPILSVIIVHSLYVTVQDRISGSAIINKIHIICQMFSIISDTNMPMTTTIQSLKTLCKNMSSIGYSALQFSMTIPFTN